MEPILTRIKKHGLPKLFLFLGTDNGNSEERSMTPTINSQHLTTDTRQPGTYNKHWQWHPTIHPQYSTTDARQLTTDNVRCTSNKQNIEKKHPTQISGQRKCENPSIWMETRENRHFSENCWEKITLLFMFSWISVKKLPVDRQKAKFKRWKLSAGGKNMTE